MGEVEIKEKFKPLWTEDYYIALITGGRGSGKSFVGGMFIENLSFEKNHKVLFTRYTLDSASDSIIPEFEEKITLCGHEPYFYITKRDVINKASGSEILFRGLKTASGNQTAKLKSLEGLTTWVLEEAEELTDKDIYDKIKQSIRKKGIQNRIILILNPSDINHWIYKEFFEGKDIPDDFCGVHDNTLYIHSTYLDNLDNLSDEFIEEAEKSKKYTPYLYNNQYLGQWIHSKTNAIFNIDKLKRYSILNQEGTNLMYIDTADEGSDHFAAIIGRLLGNYFYVYDAIFNLNNLTVNEPIVEGRINQHKLDQVYCESNSFGAYFIRNIRTQNPHTRIVAHRNSRKKIGRILAQSGFILEFFIFPENPSPELSDFITQMCSVTPESKDNDDAADCTAGMAERIRRDYFL